MAIIYDKPSGIKYDIPNEQQLSNMSSSDLMNLRTKFVGMPQDRIIAPYEHQAFARESVKENPLIALPMTLGIPLYQLGKATGLSDLSGYTNINTGETTPASMGQLLHGFKGIGEGLYNYVH